MIKYLNVIVLLVYFSKCGKRKLLQQNLLYLNTFEGIHSLLQLKKYTSACINVYLAFIYKARDTVMYLISDCHTRTEHICWILYVGKPFVRKYYRCASVYIKFRLASFFVKIIAQVIFVNATVVKFEKMKEKCTFQIECRKVLVLELFQK